METKESKMVRLGGSLLNTDNESLLAYKAARSQILKIKNLEKTVCDLQKDVAELKETLAKILKL